jgi:hypothetical protein
VERLGAPKSRAGYQLELPCDRLCSRLNNCDFLSN